MKIVKILPVLLVFLVASCSTVQVATDYDTQKDFKQYKTFAFYKKGIDKAEISDLDKKRILRAIDAELTARGMTKSTNPDVLVNIFAKSRKRVNVYDNSYYGWRPWYYGPNFNTHVSKYIEGTLFVDLIDAKAKDLVWQGIGSGALVTSSVKRKDKRIKEFVARIMSKYPQKVQ